MSGLVLSLFPGIGLLDMAFEEQGFCVVRGPDLLWGGDIGRFHPPAGRFDGVIGGPPCQFASALRHHIEHRGDAVAENRIPEFERVVRQSRPAWFLMENVVGAPLPVVDGYIVRGQITRDYWCGGETFRKRRFSFGSTSPRPWQIETLALHRPDPERSALASGGSRPGFSKDRRTSLRDLGWKTKEALVQHRRLQGLPPDFLADAPFTTAGKIKVIGNGVPLAMGRAVAAAVKAAVHG